MTESDNKVIKSFWPLSRPLRMVWTGDALTFGFCRWTIYSNATKVHLQNWFTSVYFMEIEKNLSASHSQFIKKFEFCSRNIPTHVEAQRQSPHQKRETKNKNENKNISREQKLPGRHLLIHVINRPGTGYEKYVSMGSNITHTRSWAIAMCRAKTFVKLEKALHKTNNLCAFIYLLGAPPATLGLASPIITQYV